jgi:ABC-2 type transport system ATP-binding protein
MAITVSNLSKVYDTQRAVDDITFEVKTGEVVGFLGPNGAGKSTTMKIITCYLTPTSGTVELDGYSIADHSEEVRRRIGYLPENNPLYLDMAIVDYLRYVAELHHMPKDQINARIREMIDICGLGRERHKNIGELSKGYRQRVGLAQALIHNPQVLILDEPTTGLDPNQIVEIRELIKQIGREKTVMLSSHILKEVETTCDRVIIINRGKLVADDTTENLKQRARGANQILVQFKSADGSAGDALLRLASAAKVVKGDLDRSWLVDAKPGAPLAEEIFGLAVKNNWIITQLTPHQSSLEDVFRELTVN